ncbi:MAG TPA: hypothetical protein VKT82_15000 [Ktedonobacterales bacterium]|nr:hypothetical protein [Ktedonobacterales bacterium]
MPAAMFMQEFVLSHPEFLVLLDAVQAHLVVGIDPKSLFPLDEGERRAVLEEGKAALQQRGALKNQGPGEYQLTPAFGALARTIAYPEVAIVIVRDMAGIGPQLFLHYTARGKFVEQTFPREHVHRLALLPDLTTMIERERYILALEDIPATDTMLEMSEDTFRAVKDLVRYQPPERAEAFFTRYGATASEAVTLYQAFAHRTSTGSVAILRCDQEKIIDARSIFVLQGAGSAWHATQKEPGVPLLSIQSTNASDIKYQLLQYFEALSPSV